MSRGTLRGPPAHLRAAGQRKLRFFDRCATFTDEELVALEGALDQV